MRRPECEKPGDSQLHLTLGVEAVASPTWSFECYDPRNRFSREGLSSAPTFKKCKNESKRQQMRQSET